MPISPVPSVIQVPIQKITGLPRVASEVVDTIAVEEPLEISLAFGSAGARRRETVSITMRTPGQDPELAAGFLFTEGIIPDAAAIASTSSESPNEILLTLGDTLLPRLDNARRHSYTNSSCGVCGKVSMASLYQHPVAPATPDETVVDASLLYSLPGRLRENQNVFNATGGLHAAALFDTGGRLIAIREDIGRHNALDKIIGYALRQSLLPLDSAILLLSGRACFELIQKAAMAGIIMVVAIGPPSSMAISLAEESGITLVGFLREQRFNVYTGARRLHL